MSRVAVLGLGAMGLPIARRLAERGHVTRGWNRTPGRADLAGSQVVDCGTIAEAVKGAELVLTVLADDNALRAVLPEILAVAEPGQTVVNLGTVSSETVRALAEAAAEHQVGLVDVGTLGNSTHAGTGELRCYVGGEDLRMGPVLKLLADLGKEISHVGPVGAGMDVKLVLNLMMGLEMQALAEVAKLGEVLGLPRQVVLDTVSGSGFGAPVMRFKSKRMIAGRYRQPDFRLALMAKDLDLAVRAAGAIELPMSAAARDAHRSAVAAGWGEQDCAAIADALGGAAPPAGGRP